MVESPAFIAGLAVCSEAAGVSAATEADSSPSVAAAAAGEHVRDGDERMGDGHGTPAMLSRTPATFFLSAPAAVPLVGEETPAVLSFSAPAVLPLSVPAVLSLSAPAVLSLSTPAALSLSAPAALPLSLLSFSSMSLIRVMTTDISRSPDGSMYAPNKSDSWRDTDCSG
jgi:hypothetical protein